LQVFLYNFSKLSVASTLLYGYIAVIPLIGWAVSKWVLAAPFGLIDLVCIYGYALTVLIPAAVICVVSILAHHRRLILYPFVLMEAACIASPSH